MYKKIFVFFVVCFFCGLVYAENYAVRGDSGDVFIVNYKSGSNDSLAEVVNDLGLEGRPIQRVYPLDLPPTKEDRVYWKMNDIPIGKKIVVDEVQKEYDRLQAEQKRKDKEEKIASTIKKICPSCTEQEFKDLINGLE